MEKGQKKDRGKGKLTVWRRTSEDFMSVGGDEWQRAEASSILCKKSGPNTGCNIEDDDVDEYNLS